MKGGGPGGVAGAPGAGGRPGAAAAGRCGSLGTVTFNVRIPAASKPGSTADRFLTVRIISPAPIRSTTVSATSATTSAPRADRDAPAVDPRDDRKASATRDARTRKAGTRPSTSPQKPVAPIVNNTTVRLSSGCENVGSEIGDDETSVRSASFASPRPATAPMTARTQLSVISCRRRRARPAPSAVRTAISVWRDSARLMSRFATFAHAMSNTNTTAAISASTEPLRSP